MCDRCSIDIRKIFKIFSGHFRLLWVSFGATLGSLLAFMVDFGVLIELIQYRKALGGTCDGYMCGFGGAQQRKS